MINLPIQATIKEIELPVQQIIVNNEVQVITAKTYCLCCSSCNRIIYSFNQEVKYTDVYGALMQSKDNLTKSFGYCPECGKQLRYDFDIFDIEKLER